jgi:hypothetical protein
MKPSIGARGAKGEMGVDHRGTEARRERKRFNRIELIEGKETKMKTGS